MLSYPEFSLAYQVTKVHNLSEVTALWFESSLGPGPTNENKTNFWI